MKYTESCGNVFKDLGFNDVDARIYQFRSYLMIALNKYIQTQGFNQAEAAEKLKVSQPRISNLIHGKIDLFSTGMLLDVLERAEFRIYERIEDDVEAFITKQSTMINHLNGLAQHKHH